jgi:hypothetical protein
MAGAVQPRGLTYSTAQEVVIESKLHYNTLTTEAAMKTNLLRGRRSRIGVFRLRGAVFMFSG